MIHRPCQSVFALLVVLLTTTMLHAQQEPFDYAQWRQFWSFRPVTKPDLPAVKNKDWPRNAVDHFILAKLEAHGLSPAPEADRLTLIRRATFDLTGLPPTLAEIDAFLKDTSADAYDRLIARLLDSPHYGERHGRHWLDVVRYEQGKVKLPGIKNTRGELDYRDYIVRAFNSDKPYDRLILEHLAGDLLPPPADEQQYFDQLTATAFLSIGQWFDECTDPNRLRLDIIDEQINAFSKAFLGLTVSCARCHDHKFDPITEKDYYALAGIFASTRIIDVFNENWKDGRVRLTRERLLPGEEVARRKLQEELAAKRLMLWREYEQAFSRIKGQLQEINDAPLGESVPAFKDVRTFEAEQFTGQSDLRIVTLNDGRRDIEVIEAQAPNDQWVKYELHAPEAGDYVLDLLHTAAEDTRLTVQVGGVATLSDVKLPDTLGNDWSHRRWTTLGVLKLREGVNTIRIAPSDKSVAFPRIDRLRWRPSLPQHEEALTKAADRWRLPREIIAEFAADRAMTDVTPSLLSPDTVHRLRGDAVTALTDAIAGLGARLTPVDRLITVTDHDQPTDLPIHLGGDTYRVSTSAMARATPVLFEHAVRPPVMPADQSGRLELAKWLTDPNHPLTARVMVNRLWQSHFGTGIVDTPNDLGSRGGTPSHPQLLDHLAASFIEEKWSMKKIHFLIMTSATYRQASRHEGEPIKRVTERTEKRKIDGCVFVPTDTRHLTPDTRLFSPYPRRRLEVEAIYDAMLAATGKVPRQPAGQPLDLNRSADRMMYVLTANRSPVGLGGEIRKMFAVFDYDPTGEPIGRRDESVTAAQSLFWLNSPIPRHFAGEFARSLLRDDRLNDQALLQRAWRIALTRDLDEPTQALLLEHLKSSERQGLSREQAWTRLCLAIYASTEFRYLD